MVFQNPGLEALHQFVTKGATAPAAAIEETVVEAIEEKAVIEEIAKDVQEDARLERPQWKGFG